MEQVEILLTIERQFAEVLAELSPVEGAFNKRLGAATARVAKLLESVAAIRRSQQNKEANRDSNKL